MKMMETNEEEQEQAVVTSSSSPNSTLDTLDSKSLSLKTKNKVKIS